MRDVWIIEHLRGPVHGVRSVHASEESAKASIPRTWTQGNGDASQQWFTTVDDSLVRLFRREVQPDQPVVDGLVPHCMHLVSPDVLNLQADVLLDGLANALHADRPRLTVNGLTYEMTGSDGQTFDFRLVK